VTKELSPSSTVLPASLFSPIDWSTQFVSIVDGDKEETKRDEKRENGKINRSRSGLLYYIPDGAPTFHVAVSLSNQHTSLVCG
jgi:hypothetical protein